LHVEVSAARLRHTGRIRHLCHEALLCGDDPWAPADEGSAASRAGYDVDKRTTTHFVRHLSAPFVGSISKTEMLHRPLRALPEVEVRHEPARGRAGRCGGCAESSRCALARSSRLFFISSPVVVALAKPKTGPREVRFQLKPKGSHTSMALLEHWIAVLAAMAHVPKNSYVAR